MKTKTRKEVALLVRVTVPKGTTKSQAAREVRTLISHQSNYSLAPEDVRVLACRPLTSLEE